MKKDLLTRALHGLVALAVIHQLAISEWMQPPKGDRPGNFAFEMHKTVGMITFGIVVTFWLWGLIQASDTGSGALFPWFSAARRRALAADLRATLGGLRRLRLPEAPPYAPLASAVQGLGLLAVIATAATGLVWLFFASIDRAVAHPVAELHGWLSKLVWAYIIGHGAVAVLHDLWGHPVLRRMFPFGRR